MTGENMVWFDHCCHAAHACPHIEAHASTHALISYSFACSFACYPPVEMSRTQTLRNVVFLLFVVPLAVRCEGENHKPKI